MISKRCNKCQVEKPESEFSRKASNKSDGLNSHCKQCVHEYRKANRQKIYEYDKSYRKANRPKVLDHKKRYQKSHREKILEYQRSWRRANPEYRSRSRGRYRALKRGLTVGELLSTPQLGDRDNWVCYLCNESVDKNLQWPDPLSPSQDHVIPLSRGGPHSAENLALAHLVCNLRKGNRLAKRRGPSH